MASITSDVAPSPQEKIESTITTALARAKEVSLTRKGGSLSLVNMLLPLVESTIVLNYDHVEKLVEAAAPDEGAELSSMIFEMLTDVLALTTSDIDNDDGRMALQEYADHLAAKIYIDLAAFQSSGHGSLAPEPQTSELRSSLASEAEQSEGEDELDESGSLEEVIRARTLILEQRLEDERKEKEKERKAIQRDFRAEEKKREAMEKKREAAEQKRKAKEASLSQSRGTKRKASLSTGSSSEIKPPKKRSKPEASDDTQKASNERPSRIVKLKISFDALKKFAGDAANPDHSSAHQAQAAQLPGLLDMGPEQSGHAQRRQAHLDAVTSDAHPPNATQDKLPAKKLVIKVGTRKAKAADPKGSQTSRAPFLNITVAAPKGTSEVPDDDDSIRKEKPLNGEEAGQATTQSIEPQPMASTSTKRKRTVDQVDGAVRPPKVRKTVSQGVPASPVPTNMSTGAQAVDSYSLTGIYFSSLTENEMLHAISIKIQNKSHTTFVQSYNDWAERNGWPIRSDEELEGMVRLGRHKWLE